MKISVLPILAGAMTVFAQLTPSSSPFQALTNAVNTFDITLAGFTGSLLQVPGVVVAMVTVQGTISAICSTPQSPQPSDIQEQWLADASGLLDAIATSIGLYISKKKAFESGLLLLGDPLILAILKIFQSLVPVCIDDFRPAFDSANQGALDNVQSNGTALLERGIDAYS